MFYLKKSIRPVLIIVLMIMPTLLSVIAAIRLSLLFAALAVISLFFSIWLLPHVKKHESLWMFVLSAISLMPANIRAILLILNLDFLKSDIFVYQLIKGVFYFIVLLSVEEVVLGTITRQIWRHQFATVV